MGSRSREVPKTHTSHVHGKRRARLIEVNEIDIHYTGFSGDDYANHQSDANLTVEDLDRAGLVVIVGGIAV